MAVLESLHLDRLPPLARDLVELLGLDATVVLVRRWRYQRLYVPARPAAEHPISQAIGQDNAQRLADWLRDERFREWVDVPGCSEALQAARDAAILAAAKEATTNQLVQQFGVSRRTIFNAKTRASEAEDSPPPPDLFSFL
jgi:hypothetical protein